MISEVTHLQPTEGNLLTPEEAFEWPRQAIREKNWPEAAKRWTVLRKAYPNHPATWFQGANAHMEMGELDEAERLLLHAREQFPNHPNALIDLAVLAIRRHNWENAEELLSKAREQHTAHLPAWMTSAECAEKMGDLDQAASYYQQACEVAPDRPGPLIQYAELAMRTGQWGEALKRWVVVRERFPDVPAGFHRAAEAARQLGRHKEARQLLLTHQYGADILKCESESKNPPRQRGRHASLGRLLELIWTKAIFNLRSEVHRNYLSYGWWVLEPLLHMVVYYVVFGLLLLRGGDNFPVFLLTGLVPWMWFMKAVSGSSNSILTGQNLMLQVGLPSVIFPLVSILQSTLKQIPVFVLLVGFLWLQGYSPNVYWWMLLPVIFVQALLVLAFASIVAAMIPFARDLTYLVPTGLTLLMFLSGIFYDYRSISPEWQGLFLMNPMAFLLKCYREIFMDGIMPDTKTLTYWGMGSAIACTMVLYIYKRLRYIYPRIILE